MNAPPAKWALALAGAGAALAGPWSGGARAADPALPAVLSEPVPAWLFWLVLAAAFAVAGLALRVAGGRAAARAEAAALADVLAARDAALLATDAGWLALGPGGAPEAPSPGLAERLGCCDPGSGGNAVLAALRRRLGDADRAALDDGLTALAAAGTTFGMTATEPDGGRSWRLDGRATAGGALLAVTDVTPVARAGAARAIADDGLAVERDRLLALLDRVPLPVWQRARDLSLVYCNRAYARAVDAEGPAAALFEGREIGGTAVERGGRGLAERARRTGTAQSESQHVVIAGERRLLEFTEVPLGDGEVAGFAQDMTTLEHVQDELGRHIEAHAEVLETLGSGIAIFGPDRRLRFHNRAFAELWRLDPESLHGEPDFGELLEVLRAGRRLPEVADFRSFKRQQLDQFRTVLAPQESFVYLPDDRVLRSVVAPHPLGGLILLFEDVTDRLALERSYNTLITVQRETIDALQEAIAVFGSDGRLKLSNPAYAKLWHLSAETLAGGPHANELIEHARPLLEAAGQPWEEARAELIGRIVGRSATSGRQFRTDGSVVDYTLAPLADGGVLYTASDVTDTYNVEQALIERNSALEEADRLKSEFLANVSYELRTPLNTIIGFAEILNNGYFGSLNQRQGEYCAGIIDASQRLEALINDILDLAMIEAGQIELDLGRVEIDAVAGGILNLARERARNQNLDIRLECPPEVGAIVADERRLRQVLFNLVSNAIKFTPPGGRITLAAARRPEEVTITVTDTGTGIDEADQARVFGAFQQGGSGEGRVSGAGLGLTLVKRFVEMHGGRVTLESRPGAGTRVTCHLPDAGAAVGPAAPPALAEPS